MDFVQFPEATHLIGAPKGSTDGDVQGLPAAIGTVVLKSGTPAPCIVSCFKPSAEEIEELINGGALYLHIISNVQPVVSISTFIQADLPPRN